MTSSHGTLCLLRDIMSLALTISARCRINGADSEVPSKESECVEEVKPNSFSANVGTSTCDKPCVVVR